MKAVQIKTILAASFGGTFLFVCLVAFSLITAQFNADTLPNLPWFPVPVLAVIFGMVWWCDKRWDIGLRTPCKAPVMLIAVFAVVSNIAAETVFILEKAWHGTVHAAPAALEGVSTVFAVTYWVAISIALSTSSEFCFRGIIQSILSRHLGLWVAIIVAVLFNTFAHPWETIGLRFFALLAVLFAWGWLRHISGSLKVCIITHIASVMGGNVIYGIIGPVDFGKLSQSALVTTAVIGFVALAMSVYLSRRITSRNTQTLSGALPGAQT